MNESTDLGAIVADCLQNIERDGVSASIEVACARHPQLAPQIRAAIAQVRALGLVDSQPEPAGHGFPPTLGDYRLLEPIGEGGMGVVFAAEQQKLGRRVALKVIRPDQLHFDGARTRLLREVAAAAKLSHSNIVSVFDVGEHDGIPFFAMEYVAGRSLAHVIAATRHRDVASLSGADIRKAIVSSIDQDSSDAGSSTDAIRLRDESYVRVMLRITRQAALALAHAHARQVVHRDVKPSNIMLTPAGRVVLVDFGLARSATDAKITRTGSALGSLAYMAPEQVRGQSADERSDVYSLGVTLYECLTQTPAFPGTDAHAIQSSILDGAIRAPRAIDRSLTADIETVCMKACRLEPGDRYASAAEFAEDLSNVLEMRPIHARRPGAVTRTQRWLQRHRTRAVAIGLGALVALSIPVLWKAESRAADAEAAANSSFEDSRRFVDSLLKRIDDEQLSKSPATSELHRQLMTDVLAQYEKLRAKRPEDVPFTRRAAALHRDYGFAFASLQAHDESERALRAAIEMTSGLPRLERDDHSLLVRCWNSLLNERLKNGRTEQAHTAAEAAARVHEAAARSFPADEELGVARVRFQIHRAQMAERGKRYEARDRCFGEAIRAARALHAATPTAEVSSMLGAALYEFGLRLHRERKRERAIAHFREAIAMHRAASKASPREVRYPARLSRSQTGLGVALRRIGELENAERALLAAEATARKLIKLSPTHVVYSSQLGTILHNIASLRLQQDRLEDALKAVQAARTHQRRAFDANPKRREFRRFMANHASLESRIRAGRGEHRLEPLLAMTLDLRTDATTRFTVAQTWVRCYLNAESDPNLNDSERASLRDSYLASAIATLQDALEAGFDRADLFDASPWLQRIAKHPQIVEIRAKLED